MKFRLDYAGGWGKYRTLYWKTFRGTCGAYDGPALPDVVAACKAPDGSYWAAQSWPQPLPDLGYTPWNAARRAVLARGLALDGAGRADRDRHGPGSTTAASRICSAATRIAAQPVYGFGTTRVRRADGRIRRADLSRHVQLRVRTGLAKGELVRLAQSHGRLLLRLLSRSTRPRAGTRIRRARRRCAGPGRARSTALFAEGPGVTPDVAVIVPGLHAVRSAQRAGRRARAAGVGDARSRTATRAAAPGCSARRRSSPRSRLPPARVAARFDSGPIVTATTAVAGIDDVAGGGFEPPDPQVAAGPGFVVEMVNLDGRVWRTGGGDAAAGLDVHARVVLRRGRRHAHRPADPVRRRQRPLVRVALRRGHEQRLRRRLVERRPDRALERQLVRRGRLRRPAAARRRRRRRRARRGHLPELRRAVLAGARLGALGDQQGSSSCRARRRSPDRLRPGHELLELRARAVALVRPRPSTSSRSTTRARRSCTSWPSTGIPPAAGADHGGRDARRSASSSRRRTRRSRRSSNGGRRISIATNDDRILDSVWENGKLWFAGNDRLPASRRLRAARVRARRRALDRDRHRRLGHRPQPQGRRRLLPGAPSRRGRRPRGRLRRVVRDPAPARGGGRADAGRDVHAARRRSRRATARTPATATATTSARRGIPSIPSVVWVVGETATAAASSRGLGDGVGSRRRHAGRRDAARRRRRCRRPPSSRGRRPGRRERRCSCSTSRSRPGPACAQHVTVSSGKRVVFTRTTAARTMRTGQVVQRPVAPGEDAARRLPLLRPLSRRRRHAVRRRAART